MITINVTGQETLTEEIETFVNGVDSSIPVALNEVGAHLGEKLDTRLREDWYNGYKPHTYIRRTDNPIFGKGLMSDEYKDYFVESKPLNEKNTRSTKRLTFTYEPSGEHAIESWHKRDKNALIRSIETGKLYGDPPPRPFWEDFVDELENGDAMDLFITAMKPYSVILEGEDDRYIRFKGSYLIK